jgi:5-carboxymethyl-2-hydroxymuconate isomerase
MSLRIGKGRSEADRKRAGEAIFAAVSAFLSERFETPHFMLSLEIREIDADLSWKKNAIHPRLRQKTS